MKHVVVDLEMNPVSREFREVRRKLNEEVIEIGQCYVKPEYGPIKKHITSLTGITQAMVADKKTYAACFQDFVDWVGEEETKIYSWSMSDIKQLRSECRYKLPDLDIGWLNARCSRSSTTAWACTTASRSSTRSVRWTTSSRARSTRHSRMRSTRVPS